MRGVKVIEDKPNRKQEIGYLTRDYLLGFRCWRSIQAFRMSSMNDSSPSVPASGFDESRNSPRIGGVSPTNAAFPATERSKVDPMTRSGACSRIADFDYLPGK